MMVIEEIFSTFPNLNICLIRQMFNVKENYYNTLRPKEKKKKDSRDSISSLF